MWAIRSKEWGSAAQEWAREGGRLFAQQTRASCTCSVPAPQGAVVLIWETETNKEVKASHVQGSRGGEALE